MRRFGLVMPKIAVVACLALAALSLHAVKPVLANGLADVRAGNEAFKNGALEDAIAAYSRAILSGELDIGAMAITFNNRGVVYGELGDFDRAINDYQEALALQPSDATTLKNLRVAFGRRANAFENLGEPEQAIADYTQALAIDGSHVASLQQRAGIFRKTGDLNAARSDLERAAALEPANQEIKVSLAEVQAEIRTQQAAASTEPAAVPAEQPATAAAADSSEAATEVAAVEAPEAAGADESAAVSETIEQAKRAEEVVFTDADFANAKIFRAISAVNFRTGPGNDFDRLGAVDQGAEVQVVGIELGWMQVILQNGQQGYIYKKWLEPVASAEAELVN